MGITLNNLKFSQTISYFNSSFFFSPLNLSSVVFISARAFRTVSSSWRKTSRDRDSLLGSIQMKGWNWNPLKLVRKITSRQHGSQCVSEYFSSDGTLNGWFGWWPYLTAPRLVCPKDNVFRQHFCTVLIVIDAKRCEEMRRVKRSRGCRCEHDDTIRGEHIQAKPSGFMGNEIYSNNSLNFSADFLS